MNYDDPSWDFRRLPAQLKLEIQYAMQRADELGTAQRNLAFGHMIRVLLHVDAHTLLEHTPRRVERRLRLLPRPPAPAQHGPGLAGVRRRRSHRPHGG
jgi:hypothetical protein